MEAIDSNRDTRKTYPSYYTTTSEKSTLMNGEPNLIPSYLAGNAAGVKNIINPTNSLTVEGHKASLISSALASGQSNAYVILPPAIDLSSPDALSALQTIASMNVKGAKTSGKEGSNDGPSTSMDRGDISGDYDPVSTNYSITTNTINEKKDVKSPTSTDVDMVKGTKSNSALSTTGDLLSAIYAVMALQVQQSSDQRQIVNKDARAQRKQAMSQTKVSFDDKILSAEKQKKADVKNAQAEIASGIAGIVGGVAGVVFSSLSAWQAGKAAGGFKILTSNIEGKSAPNAESLNNMSRMWSAMSQSVSALANGIGSTISGSIRLGAADYSYEAKVQSAMAELASAAVQTLISNIQADQSSYSTASQNIDATVSAMKQAGQMMYDQNLTINRNI